MYIAISRGTTTNKTNNRERGGGEKCIKKPCNKINKEY